MIVTVAPETLAIVPVTRVPKPPPPNPPEPPVVPLPPPNPPAAPPRVKAERSAEKLVVVELAAE